MAKRKSSGKKKTAKQKFPSPLHNVLSLYNGLAELKKQLSSLSESETQTEERLADLEVHLNLLTRLLTTLCVEKFGMRIGVLKRLVKRIEKEAVRDSQILELESWYRLSHANQKKPVVPPGKPKEDPWDKIS